MAGGSLSRDTVHSMDPAYLHKGPESDRQCADRVAQVISCRELR